MKKIFKSGFTGEFFEEEFKEHDISKYDVLYHVTTLSRLTSIEKEGLKLGKDLHKSITETNMLFFSYPIEHNTGDLFRCYDDSIIVVLDAEALHKAGICFYDDNFSDQDRSSKRNHLCCDVDVPKEFIKKIIDLNKK